MSGSWGPASLICNWKMNGAIQKVQRTLHELRDQLDEKGLFSNLERDLKIIVCPPYPYLSLAKQIFIGTPLHLGAQDMDFRDSGAFTGAVSGMMLEDVGCNTVILGHSERREFFGETEEFVGRKAAKAVELGLHPIICVGESSQVNLAGETKNFVLNQILSSLQFVPSGSKLTIAYEPLWAIGSGRSAEAEDVQNLLEALAREPDLQDHILEFCYGGSVGPQNIGSFLTQPTINSVLVGGLSLKPQDLVRAIQTAVEVTQQPKNTWKVAS